MKLKLLINKEEIKNKVKELAEKINKDYKEKEPILIGILNGCFVFMADLVRELKIPVEIDFVKIRSYAGTETTGKIEMKLDIERDIRNKDVIIIEDIVDTGLTLNYLVKYLKRKGAKSIKICALLDKPKRRRVDIKIDYLGFKIPNLFVVGYGLDVDERFRELPEIYYIEQEQ